MVEPAVKDRSLALVLAGIVVVGLGVVCFAFCGFTLLSLQLPRPPGAGQPPPLRLMLPSLFLYVAAGIFFVWSGVGVMLGRRWARALLSAVSRLWLAAGLLGGGVACWLVPRMMPTVLAQGAGAAPDAAALPAGVPWVIYGCMAGCIGVAYVLLPGALAWFFGRPSVRATCERKDPLPRWTDRCPDSVLVLVLLLGYAAAMFPATLAMGVMFAFGRVISGFAAALFAALLAATSGVLAVGVYRLRPAAWWGMVALLAFGGAAWSGFFISAATLRELYAGMGMDVSQPGMAALLAAFDGPGFGLLGLALVGAGVGYLLYVRPHFTAAT